MPYLFVHFREKLTVDGEQVYFSVSKNGYDFEKLNNGKPVLTCTKGSMGCRDIEIVKLRSDGFVILATDLCIVNRMDENHNVDWRECNHNGSKNLSMWFSDDLVNFTEQQLCFIGRDDFGCLWAPEVFFDEEGEEYLIHWGSTVKADGCSHMSIFCCKTKDFKTFSKPELFFTKQNEILDSHIVKHNGKYHLFYKNASDPSMPMHAVSNELHGEYENDTSFQKYMESIDSHGAYEAPTTYILPDGKWCLMLDFFGCEKEKMGYVPFVSEKVGESFFKMAKERFKFPYGFKHGRCIEITDAQYEQLKKAYPN